MSLTYVHFTHGQFTLALRASKLMIADRLKEILKSGKTAEDLSVEILRLADDLAIDEHRTPKYKEMLFRIVRSTVEFVKVKDLVVYKKKLPLGTIQLSFISKRALSVKFLLRDIFPRVFCVVNDDPEWKYDDGEGEFDHYS